MAAGAIEAGGTSTQGDRSEPVDTSARYGSRTRNRSLASGAGGIYLSDRFVQRCKQAKLKGLDFILAWDSDLPPEAQPTVWASKPIKL